MRPYLLLVLLVNATALHAQLTLSPAFPKAGETVTVRAVGALPDIGLAYEVVEVGGQEYFASGFTPDGTFTAVLPEAGYYYAEEDAAPTSNDTTFQDLPFVVTQPGLSSASAFKGQYSLLCEGEQGAGDVRRGEVGAIGSFTADGAGKITAGIVDLNTVAGVVLNQPLTGTYSLDSTGVGELMLQTAQGPASYVLTGNPFEFVANGLLLSGSLTGSTSGATSSCSVALQHPPPFLGDALIDGGYLLQLHGEKACTGPCTEPRAISGNALLSLNGDGTATAVVSENGPGLSIQNAALSGVFAAGDVTTGRTTIRLTAPGESATAPTNFVAYPIDSKRIYLMSTDPHGAADLLAGSAPR